MRSVSIGFAVAGTFLITCLASCVGQETNKPTTRPSVEVKHVWANANEAKLKKYVEPVYPKRAIELGKTGIVRLKIQTSMNGTVTNIEVLSGDPFLIGAAVEAAKQWVYETEVVPGKRLGIAVTVELNFKLTTPL